jgi:hypothetical protein
LQSAKKSLEMRLPAPIEGVSPKRGELAKLTMLES